MIELECVIWVVYFTTYVDKLGHKNQDVTGMGGDPCVRVGK